MAGKKITPSGVIGVRSGTRRKMRLSKLISIKDDQGEDSVKPYCND